MSRGSVMRTVGLAFTLAIPVALLVAGLMMKLAWDHNPQGEFHGEAHSDLNRLLTIGLLWATASLATFTPIFSLLITVIARFR